MTEEVDPIFTDQHIGKAADKLRELELEPASYMRGLGAAAYSTGPIGMSVEPSYAELREHVAELEATMRAVQVVLEHAGGYDTKALKIVADLVSTDWEPKKE